MNLSFKGASLFHKLLFGYLVLLSIMILPCGVSIYSLSQLKTMATEMAHSDIKLFRTIEHLKAAVAPMEIEARRLVTLHKRDAYDSLISLTGEFRANLEEIEGNRNRDLQRLSREIDGYLGELIHIAQEADKNISGQEDIEISPVDAKREEKIKRLSAQIMADLKRLEHELQRMLSIRSSTISELSSWAKEITLVTLGLALIFALSAPAFFYKYIKLPIDYLMQGTEVIGEGRFDEVIPVVSNDELGKLAEAFNAMTIRLKELDKLKSDFIAMAGHELRTPLTSMAEAGKLLTEKEIGPLNTNQEKLVKVLNKSMKRLQTLIEELLHLSKLKAKLEAIEKRPHSVNKIICEAKNTLKPIAWEKGVKIDFQYPDGQDIMAYVDEERLFRAIINILHNAVKFSPERAKIKIFLKKDNNHVTIGIVDCGPGIDASEKDKIFDKFYQIQSIRRKDGSGLGLAIAQEIIFAHGGQIWVESPPPENVAIQPGKGAAFWVSLSL